MPTLDVFPVEALVDEPLKVKVTGLQQGEEVTLSASLWQKDVIFLSCAHYVADDVGVVDVARDFSLGGTYTGVEPMGLFWSMIEATSPPGRRYTRLHKADVTTPFNVDVRLHRGHIPFDFVRNAESLPGGTRRVHRWYIKSSVKRITVKEERIRGRLLIPSGAGPFPGVIDLYGSRGGLVEKRAALLASRGFVVLALAYVDYDNLTKDLEHLDFNYFEEAVDWFASRSCVMTGGVGVIGISKGGDLALVMAENIPKVTCVVCINSAPALVFTDLLRGNEIFKEAVPLDLARLEGDVETGMVILNCYSDWNGKLLKPWQHGAHVMFISCGDDMSVNPEFAQIMLDSVPQDKRELVEVVTYPGAGHLLETPYTPLCRVTWHSPAGLLMNFGGIPKPHADAQEISWKAIIDFFHKHLNHKHQAKSKL